ncbi:hypothetical protein [Actinoplanes sp. NPDC049681]|uniref:hypothetical protein n=1 Tax=Actinoplanes sp. NPDC049681 TaxID=3363905 RepID=UPI0037935AC7
MDDERVAAVIRLWREHLQTPYPSRLRGTEISGIDMVLLDADTAGCIHAWLEHVGQLSSEAQVRLSTCLSSLNHVLPLLTNPVEAGYYRRLRDLADLICEPPD